MRDTFGFADYLRRAMRAVGIDPDQRGAAAVLARKTDVSETQTSRWLKKGHQPSIDNLRKLSAVLHVRMADLLVAAGYVNADELSTTTTTAERGILTDPSLSERERRLLLTLLNEVRDRTDDDTPSPPAQRSDGDDSAPDAAAS